MQFRFADTNYNRKIYKWPQTPIESEYPGYRHDIVDEGSQLEEGCRSNGSDDDFAVERINDDRDYRAEDDYYESYERVGGGCEDSRVSKGAYSDHCHAEESVDHRSTFPLRDLTVHRVKNVIKKKKKKIA